MTENMLELRKRIRSEFSRRFSEDPEIEKIYKMVRNRSADYADAQRFAIEVGDILTECLQGEDYTGINLYELADDIMQMLDQNVRLIDTICDTIQGQMNESVNIGIEPIAPKMAPDRKDGIRDAVINANSNEDIYNAAASATNYGQAVVDEWVRTNAEFQVKSGLGATIVRVWSGSYPSHDTKHTDWCHDLAGVYQYEPGNAGSYARNSRMWSIEGDKNIFARHKGCRCTVSFYPAGTSKGTITALAKGEKDTEKQLWNTGKSFSNSRSAQLRRRRERYGKDEARRMLNEEWKGGYNGNAERHF